MALTAEQKTQNKAAQKLRDQQYRARRKEYEVEKERRIAEFHVSTDFKSAMDKAYQANDRAIEARSAAQNEIHRQIADLQDKLKKITAEHNTIVDDTNVDRLRTNKAYFDAKKAIEDAVDAQFSDIAGVYSAVQWAPRVKP